MTFNNDLHNKRLTYYGEHAHDRLEDDKLRSLHKALLYSYQSAIIDLHDLQFRCLINPDKNKPDYDNKIISIPFNEPCMTTHQNEDTNIKPGDVFTWLRKYDDREQDSHWLVFLQYLEETAYFRAEIRRCDQQAIIDDIPYWVYIRGPVETQVIWNQKASTEWNDLNYSLVMYVTKDEHTIKFFKRFQKIKIREEITGIDRTWQVVANNQYYGDGIIEVFLDEEHENPIQEAREKELAEQIKPEPPISRIEGPDEVMVLDTVVFSNGGLTDGRWSIRYNGHRTKLDVTGDKLTLNINFGKSGIFTLYYDSRDYGEMTKNVKIIPI